MKLITFVILALTLCSMSAFAKAPCALADLQEQTYLDIASQSERAGEKLIEDSVKITSHIESLANDDVAVSATYDVVTKDGSKATYIHQQGFDSDSCRTTLRLTWKASVYKKKN